MTLPPFDGARSRVAVIVPALNEAGNVAAVVRGALAQPVDWVIVVDNGSNDETAAVAAEAGALVVAEPRRGYGYACRAGSEAALGYEAEILTYMDADSSSRPEELGRLIEPILSSAADLVLGSRALGTVAEGAMMPHQRFGNWLAAWLMRRLYGVSVTDLGPFRAIRSDLYRQLGMTEMTFGWPTEMTVKTIRRGGRVLEVPASWHPRKAGRSKVSGTLRGSLLAGYHILRVTIRHSSKSHR